MNRMLRQDPRMRRLTFALLCLLASLAVVSAQQEETLKVETELLNINVVVTDRGGRRVSGLKKEDFEAYEDGVKQEISHFASEEGPLRLVLLFDTSISMEEVLPLVKQQAVRLTRELRPRDEVSVVTFASRVEWPMGWVNRDHAEEQIRSLRSETHQSPLPPTIGRPGYNVGDGNALMYEIVLHTCRLCEFPLAQLACARKLGIMVASDSPTK